jgi:hypothetical protein
MATLNQTPDPAIQAELDRISSTYSRVPGVPDRALLKGLMLASIEISGDVLADITWPEEYKNKLTRLTMDNGKHALTAANNTEFVAKLIQFYIEAHMHRPVEPKAIGPVVCLID